MGGSVGMSFFFFFFSSPLKFDLGSLLNCC